MNPNLPGITAPGEYTHATATTTLTLPPSAPFVVPTTLPNATPGVPYSQTITAAGGQSPYTWSVVSNRGLPGGLTLDAVTGIISGTPTGAIYGLNPFTVMVTDNLASTALLSLSIFVLWPGTALAVTGTILTFGSVGNPYSQTVAAAGGLGPYAWSLFGSLPPGLTLSSSGVISGTPTRFGIFSFTIQVADATGINLASQQFSISIKPILTIDTISLPPATVGVAYSLPLSASGGTPGYIWRIISGNLPPGLTLDPQTGIISGIPTALTNSPITFEVTDSA